MKLTAAILLFLLPVLSSAQVDDATMDDQVADSAAVVANTLTLSVDARSQCLSTINGSFGQATLPIANGAYKVTLKSNAHYNFGRLLVKKVAFYLTTDDQPSGWFHVVSQGKPIFIRVSGIGTDANTLRAFFIDGICDDNTGNATLSFQRLAGIPPTCAGEDCGG
jgi:hypothetical protein